MYWCKLGNILKGCHAELVEEGSEGLHATFRQARRATLPFWGVTVRGGMLLALTLLLGLTACHPDGGDGTAKPAFFQVKNFFHADSARLTQQNPTVVKTVTYNGTTEKRQVHISNWGAEFSLFISSDINRPAWRDSYKTSTGNGITIYTAKTPELKTRKIIVKKAGEQVTLVYIYNHTKNLLYENYEELAYYPDSLYLIKKFQKVRVLGQKNYIVKGEIGGVHRP